MMSITWSNYVISSCAGNKHSLLTEKSPSVINDSYKSLPQRECPMDSGILKCLLLAINKLAAFLCQWLRESMIHVCIRTSKLLNWAHSLLQDVLSPERTQKQMQ